MTFKESEFPSLLKYLKSLVDDGTDPVLLRERLAQIIKFYEAVPLYPGIAQMCAGKGIKEINLGDALVGQRVCVRDGNGAFVGTVKEKAQGQIKFEAVFSSSKDGSREMAFEAGSRALLVDDGILAEMWPSLVFEGGKKS